MAQNKVKCPFFNKKKWHAMSLWLKVMFVTKKCDINKKGDIKKWQTLSKSDKKI